MSRTEGITLPRLPGQHAKATSSRALQPHPATYSTRTDHTISEPTYTAFIGTPRQDVPQYVYKDAAMFDDVFDKKGSLLLSRNTPKITAPLNSLGYSSLHDPHCRQLFLKNKQLRSHLMHLGLITEDLKVVATTTEQRQKIRAHELLERKEQLRQRIEYNELCRIEKLEKKVPLPSLYQENMRKAEEREQRARDIKEMKLRKILKAEEEKTTLEKKRREEGKKKMKVAIEEATLAEQARRNAAFAQQEMAESMAYQKQYGKYGQRVAAWKRDADRIHNQMVAMKRKQWIVKKQRQIKKKIEYSLPDNTSSTVTTQSPSPSPISPAVLYQDMDHQQRTTISTPVTIPGDDTESPSSSSGLPPPEDYPSSEEGGEGERNEEDTTEDHSGFSMEIEKLKIQEDTQEEHSQNEDQSFELAEETDGMGVTTKEEEGERERDSEEPTADVREEGDTTKNVKEEREVVVLDEQEATNQLTRILVEAFTREDLSRSGFITKDDFIRAINSRALGFQLNEADILYLTEQADVYNNGHIPFITVAPQLPDILRYIYQTRAELSIQSYGICPEEEWCEMHPLKGKGTERYLCYFNKYSGIIQMEGRPEDFRPFLRDEVFEDAIVDFFETADADKDGVLEYSNFYSLLVSPMVSTRIYSNQIEDLLSYYTEISPEGFMIMESFVPLAKALLLMIYHNTYPGEDEWIELESRNFGNFLFNKTTGEVHIPSLLGEGEAPLLQPLPSPAVGTSKGGSKKKKRKHSHRVSWSDGPISGNTQTAPPPLQRRKSREDDSRKGTRSGSGSETESSLDSIPEESD